MGHDKSVKNGCSHEVSNHDQNECYHKYKDELSAQQKRGGIKKVIPGDRFVGESEKLTRRRNIVITHCYGNYQIYYEGLSAK